VRFMGWVEEGETPDAAAYFLQSRDGNLKASSSTGLDHEIGGGSVQAPPPWSYLDPKPRP